MRETIAEYDHPAWVTMGSAFVGYTLMLVLIFAIFFVVPFLLWP